MSKRGESRPWKVRYCYEHIGKWYTIAHYTESNAQLEARQILERAERVGDRVSVAVELVTK
mgnify:CR=1 FL=1